MAKKNNLKNITDILTKNIELKIFALIVAIILWVFAKSGSM